MELKDIIIKLDALKEELDNLRPIKDEHLRKLNQKLKLDWNYHSNSIEGNTLTLSETKSFILWGVTAKGKPFRDYVEMKGHNEALTQLYKIVNKDVKITETLIKDFHRIILVEPYADEKAEINPGEWKKNHNYLYSPTGERIDFAAPTDVPELMSDLVNWLNNHIDPPKRKKKKYDLHPLLIAAGFHTKFIQIHPFGDGNGRMARILTNLILMLCGYVPAIIKLDERKNYYTAINTSNLDTPENLAVFIGEATIESLEIAIKAAKGESIEEPDDLDKQLALLEQKINSKGEQINKVKSKETLEEFWGNVLPKIAAAFISVNEKFSKFYVKMSLGTKYVNLEPIEYNNGYLIEGEEHIRYRKRNRIKTFTKENHIFQLKNTVKYAMGCLVKPTKNGKDNIISLYTNFNTFNRTEIASFDYTSILNIRFDKTHFVIDFGGEDSHSYLYDYDLTEEEIAALLKKEAQKHFDFIQQQIDKD